MKTININLKKKKAFQTLDNRICICDAGLILKEISDILISNNFSGFLDLYDLFAICFEILGIKFEGKSYLLHEKNQISKFRLNWFKNFLSCDCSFRISELKYKSIDAMTRLLNYIDMFITFLEVVENNKEKAITKYKVPKKFLFFLEDEDIPNYIELLHELKKVYNLDNSKFFTIVDIDDPKAKKIIAQYTHPSKNNKHIRNDLMQKIQEFKLKLPKNIKKIRNKVNIFSNEISIVIHKNRCILNVIVFIIINYFAIHLYWYNLKKNILYFTKQFDLKIFSVFFLLISFFIIVCFVPYILWFKAIKDDVIKELVNNKNENVLYGLKLPFPSFYLFGICFLLLPFTYILYIAGAILNIFYLKIFFDLSLIGLYLFVFLVVVINYNLIKEKLIHA